MRLKFSPLAAVKVLYGDKKNQNKMPDKLENLEVLIDNILQDEGPMTLAELINIIAQPHRYDGLSLSAA
ncbi:MAG: hypothetical protein QG584_1773 [Pseudomonadota bacterium]|nr:hypothetical protein [Pseudomonadota bacterium]